MANQTTDSDKLGDELRELKASIGDKMSELQASTSNQLNASEKRLQETVDTLSTEIKAQAKITTGKLTSKIESQLILITDQTTDSVKINDKLSELQALIVTKFSESETKLQETVE